MDVKMEELTENYDVSHKNRTAGLRVDGSACGLRVLVVGAGRVGTRVLLQLSKNPNLTIVTVDPREEPFAVAEGIITSIDYRRELTPKDLEHVIEEVAPDLVLVTTSPEDMGLEGVPGLEILVDALRGELEATAKVPVIAVSRSGLG
jgi:NADPH:quinone reductase-like Zn-dependent oxidoreductase